MWGKNDYEVYQVYKVLQVCQERSLHKTYIEYGLLHLDHKDDFGGAKVVFNLINLQLDELDKL